MKHIAPPQSLSELKFWIHASDGSMYPVDLTEFVLGNNTKCYLVYAASLLVEAAVSPAIEIASRDVTDAFNVESRQDKARYFELMLTAAGVNHLFSR